MPQSATKGLRRASQSGEALPSIPTLHRLTEDRVLFRKGQLVMIAAIPNAGKSTFVKWLVAQWNVPTMMFAADEDPFTSVVGLAACLSGQPTWTVEAALNGGPGEAYYETLLEDSRIHFCFDGNPSLEDIESELNAYVDTFDSWPEVIVVDNLINVEGSGEYQEDQFIVRELHGLARTTGSCVILLAHASENAVKDVSMPPSKKALINKVAKFPDLILTVALHEETSEFRVARVKTRGTKSDPNATRPYVLGSDFSRVQFFDSVRTQQYNQNQEAQSW